MPKVKPLYRDPLLERISGAIAVQGLTQEQMACKMKISRSKWQRMINGRTDDWTMGEVKRACRILSISSGDMRDLI